MPTVTSTVIDGWASCTNGRCAGYKQEPVRAVETLTQFSYVDLGGDVPGIERSTTLVYFADEADSPCPVCDQPRLCSDQVRPIYPNVSGQPQDAILEIGRTEERVRDVQLDQAKRDATFAQMETMMERQQRQIEQLLAERPRGPGRPRKDE